MTYRALTVAQLVVSPLNSRTDQRPLQPASINAMAKSLLKRGQIMPFVVHPMPDQDDVFGVIVGQRRLLAFQKLVATGKLPKSHPIDTVIRSIDSEADLIEISTIENLIRVDLYQYEVYAALAAAYRRGKSYEQIAEDHGQPEVSWAKQGVRMGMLAEPIFQAYADDLLNLQTAQAFAATEDTALQLQVYEEWKRLPAPDRTPASVRALMKVGDRELTRLLLFVGDEAYREAGGRFEFDLFADADEYRGLVSDEAKLRAMADAKFEELRKSIRTRANRSLRFEPGPPMNDFNRVDQSLQITPADVKLDSASEERLAALRADQAVLEEEARTLLDPVSNTPLPGTEDQVAAINARYDPNEAEIAAIEARRPIVLPDGDIFGTITVDDTGEVEIRYWWASRAAQAAANRPATAKAERVTSLRTPAPHAVTGAPREVDMRPVAEGNAIRAMGGGCQIDWTAGERADRFLKRDYGLTQDGIQSLRSLSREILRGQLLEDCDQSGHVALDYLVFGQLRMLLTTADAAAIGMRRFTQPDRQDNAGAELIDETTPGRFIAELEELRGWDCFMVADLEEAFVSFRAMRREDREHAAAMLACLVLERTLQADGYRIPLLNRVAAETGICGPAELRESEAFTPAPRFFNLFDKDHRCALAEPFVSRTALVVIAKAKTAEQTVAVSRIFTGDTDDVVSDEARATAAAWIHPLLALVPAAAATAPVEQREMAGAE